jgi:cytochrome c oxidase assembly factor CtaG
MAVDPLLVCACAAVVGAVTWSVVHLRGAAGAPWRRAAGLSAALLLAAAWLSPLQTLAAHYLLSAHLAQVLLVMGVVPPLLLLALPGCAPFAPPAWSRRVARATVHPVTGMVAINVAFFVWHVGPVYDTALRTPGLYAVQQLTLLAVSVMFWWPIVVPFGGVAALSRWGRLGYILVATIPQTFAGITLALAKHPLYAGYQAAPRVFGLGVLTDQQVAGACLALVSKLALFTAFAVVFMRMLNESSTDGGDDGGGGGWRRPGADTPSPQPSGTLGWLADLNAGRTVPEPVPARARLSSPAGAGSARA